MALFLELELPAKKKKKKMWAGCCGGGLAGPRDQSNFWFALTLRDQQSSFTKYLLSISMWIAFLPFNHFPQHSLLSLAEDDI